MARRACTDLATSPNPDADGTEVVVCSGTALDGECRVVPYYDRHQLDVDVNVEDNIVAGLDGHV